MSVHGNHVEIAEADSGAVLRDYWCAIHRGGSNRPRHVTAMFPNSITG